ncbi:MAG: NAD-dependent epimerase/dehydratase family protein [Candidatus Heimdallarchaeota archaeon]|nr:NAD-dependent epimerase/dehydratase family protein [Candidatus Heimdallarchaeota archaeon]
MTILVTGITGYLGSVLVKELLESGEYTGKDIRVLVKKGRDVTEWENLGVEVFRGDLKDKKSLTGIMKDITTVYHNAAIIVNEAVSREEMTLVNYQGTIALAEEFLKEVTAEKFIFASSFGVYGMKFPNYPIKEDSPKKPANNYQETKYLAEQYLHNLYDTQGLNVSSIRNCLILGPGDISTSPRLVRGLLAGKIPYLGKGANRLSMVDARDSCKAMILTTKKPVSKGQVYNIKSFDIKQRDYFNFYAKACNNAYPKKYYPCWIAYLFAWSKEKTTPKGKEVLITRTRVNRYCSTRLLDTTKIENELGFKPQHTNPEIVINETIDWLKKNNYL